MLKQKASRFISIITARPLMLIILILLLNLGSCSINKMVLNKVADMLSSEGSNVFTGDEDPELVGEALPFILKLYETLLEAAPDNRNLLLATGNAFTLYAYAYIQMPANILSDEELEKKLFMLNRAKKLFLRARNYILKGLEIKYPCFSSFVEGKNWEPILKQMDIDDVPYLYWAGMAWMGAFTSDVFDMELLGTVPKATALFLKALELDESFDNGGVHSFFISYYGALPAEQGGSEEKARHHFKRALEISKGLKIGPYIALAETVSVANDDLHEFKELLTKALEIDINIAPDYRLMNILSRRKAIWLLDNIENFFLIGEAE